MTYAEAIQRRADVTARYEAAAAALRAVPGVVTNGALTPDAIKFSPAFMKARAVERAAFARLREINGFVARNFKREERAARDERRAAGLYTARGR